MLKDIAATQLLQIQSRKRREIELERLEKSKGENVAQNESMEYKQIVEREKEERNRQKRKLKEDLDNQKKEILKFKQKEVLLNAREFQLNKQILKEIKGEDVVNESEQEQLLKTTNQPQNAQAL